MKSTYYFIFLILGLLALSPNPLSACTTFCIHDQKEKIVFGRNFDFPTGIGQIQINQRGIEKTSFIQEPEKPFTWTSKYGSISFNQNGREFPYGGINEKGLVIEQMMLDESKYPKIDSRFGLEELQWIQYQLDVSASVEDVVESDKIVRISASSLAPIHFSVSDINGNFATIEYVKGKMVYHTGDEVKIRVLANNTYKESMKYYNKLNQDTKSKITNSEGFIKRLDRFSKAAYMIETMSNQINTIDYAFDILNNVSQSGTQWSIVYDQKEGTIYFKTAKNKNIRQLRLKDFDFSPKAKKLYLDIDANSTDVKSFKDFSYKSNFDLVSSFWSIIPDFRIISEEFTIAWSQYPNDINNKSVRKFKPSAATKIIEICKKSGFKRSNSDIQSVLASKEYSFTETQFNNYGQLCINKKKFTEAIDFMKMTIELFPKSGEAYLTLGEAYLKLDDFDKAEENFRIALVLSPSQSFKINWIKETIPILRQPLVLDDDTKTAYVGVYGPRRIYVKSNELYYQRDGRAKLKMVPITENYFMFKDEPGFRIKINKENGKAVAIEGIYSDGIVDQSIKTE